MSRSRAIRDIATIVLTGFLALAGIVAVAYGIVVQHFARRVLRPEVPDFPLRVLAYDSQEGTIAIADNADTSVPGKYGLSLENGSYVRLGDVVRREIRNGVPAVVRHVDGATRETVQVGERARFSGWYFTDPSDALLDDEDVTIETPLGPAPAWRVPPKNESSSWVIHIHGRGATRGECVRGALAAHRAGWHSLVVSYRNDGEAPSSLDRRYGLGATEWRDVESAIRFAREQGARRVVLFGWSMGGAIALQTLVRSSIARELVVAMILDSPVVDWKTTLRYQGNLLRLPRAVLSGTLMALQSPLSAGRRGRPAVALGELDFVARADELTVPVLLFHSDNDGFVPSSASRELARRRPDLVTFVPDDLARHTKIWNVNSERWESQIADWLSSCDGAG